MEFPVTIESQEAFDAVIKDRLAREKTKQADLQAQVDSLTAEKQELESKSADLVAASQAAEERASSAEKWRTEREATDNADKLRKSVASEFGISAEALRGDTEESLKEHAQILKGLMPVAPVITDIGDSPSSRSSDASEFVAEFFGGSN